MTNKSLYNYNLVSNMTAAVTPVTITVPAFSGGDGLAYSLTCKSGDGDSLTIGNNIPADTPFILSEADFPEGYSFSELNLTLTTVPPGFADGDIIEIQYKKDAGEVGSTYKYSWQYILDENNTAVTDLVNTLALFETFDTTGYTKESLLEFETAVSEAKTLLDSEEALSSPDKALAAKEKLENAKQGLQKSLWARLTENNNKFLLLSTALSVLVIALLTIHLVMKKHKGQS